jgi:hypothetical protein
MLQHWQLIELTIIVNNFIGLVFIDQKQSHLLRYNVSSTIAVMAQSMNYSNDNVNLNCCLVFSEKPSYDGIIGLDLINAALVLAHLASRHLQVTAQVITFIQHFAQPAFHTVQSRLMVGA